MHVTVYLSEDLWAADLEEMTKDITATLRTQWPALSVSVRTRKQAHAWICETDSTDKNLIDTMVAYIVDEETDTD